MEGLVVENVYINAFLTFYFLIYKTNTHVNICVTYVVSIRHDVMALSC